jgi:hypothetical protein
LGRNLLVRLGAGGSLRRRGAEDGGGEDDPKESVLAHEKVIAKLLRIL